MIKLMIKFYFLALISMDVNSNTIDKIFDSIDWRNNWIDISSRLYVSLYSNFTKYIYDIPHRRNLNIFIDQY